MFPVFLELSGRLAVVVGGGDVGRRKAAGLLAAGARVRVVCLEPLPPEAAHERLEWRTAEYAAEHLEGAALVFAAAGEAVNARVVADARERGVWVTDASHPHRGDFHVPAVLRQGELAVAVSTGGAAPLLAARIRDRLAGQFDEAYAAWVELLRELRPALLAGVPDPARRREVLALLCEPGWLDRLRTEGPERVREAMAEVVRAEAARGP